MSKPVLNLSCKVYIPEGTQTSKRYLYLILAKKDSAGSYSNSNYGSNYFNITSTAGKVYGGASTNSTNVYRTSYTVTTNTWHQVNMRVFTNAEGKITCGMYFDGRLVVVNSSAATDISSDDIGIRQIYFNNANTTYVKDIRLDLEDYDPIWDPTATSSAVEETYLSNVLFTSGTVNSSTNALNVPCYGVAPEVFQTSSQTTAPYKSGTVYENVNYSLEDDALKVDLTPSTSTSGTHALIQNFRRNITSYFPSGTNYMQMSYDIKIPAGTETATRAQYWRIGNDVATTNLSCYEIYSKIVGGKLNFANYSTYPGDVLTKKTESFDIQSDKWYRIIALLKIVNDSADEYAVHTEGYVLDVEADATYKIYEVDSTIPKLTSGTDGLVLTQQRTDIKTPTVSTEGTKVATYYDNVITRIWNKKFSEYYRNPVDSLPADADYMFEIDLTQSDSVASARGRDADGNGSQLMLIAGYDNAGNLVSCSVSKATDENTTVDAGKGIVTLKWDFSSYSSITNLKAFMFRDLESVVPLTHSGLLNIN